MPTSSMNQRDQRGAPCGSCRRHGRRSIGAGWPAAAADDSQMISRERRLVHSGSCHCWLAGLDGRIGSGRDEQPS